MYVAITDKVRRQIERKVEAIKATEIRRIDSTLDPLPAELGSDWAETIEKAVWGKHHHLKSVLPEEWVNFFSLIDVHLCETDGEEHSCRRYRGDEIPLPPNTVDIRIPDVNISITALEPGLQEKIRAHLNLVKVTEVRYVSVWDNIQTLLARCKSINEAVGLFPDLKFFLSDEIIDKLAQKRTQNDKENAKLEGIDTALITSAMVLNELTPEE